MRYFRRDWGARPPRAVDRLPWSQVDTLFVHYTAALSDETGDPRARMRGIQNFHMDTREWNDIAYNWGFATNGDKLEGRGWQVHNAATGQENGHSQAIVFLGADRENRDDVTPAGRKAAGELIREAMNLAMKPLIVKGHTEAPDPAGNTECPGAELLAYVHARGWVLPSQRWPKRFFQWAHWYLGEGEFAKYGRRAKGHRPNVPYPIAPAYWIALRRYLKQRQR